jgi:hypothetical protein
MKTRTIIVEIPITMKWEFEVGPPQERGIRPVPHAMGYINGTLVGKGYYYEEGKGYYDPEGYLCVDQYVFTAPRPDEAWLMEQVEARFREALVGIEAAEGEDSA